MALINTMKPNQPLSRWNTVVRIAMYRQDGRGRFPVDGSSSPNLGKLAKKKIPTEIERV